MNAILTVDTALRRLNTQRVAWGRRELAQIVLACYALFALIIVGFDDYLLRIQFTGDNVSYAHETAVLRGAETRGATAAHFLGYPLLAAPIASLFGISDFAALAIVSTLGSLVAVVIAGELWGGLVAAWFAITSLDWFQRSLLGGADPVFAAFVFGALLSARRERWLPAAVLGACATVVRPLGIVLLLALGLELLRRRKFAGFAAAVGISLAVGAAYLALVGALFGESFANLLWYKSMGLGEDRSFIPFVTIFLPSPEHPLTQKVFVKTLFWMTFTALAVVAALRRRAIHEAVRAAPVEWLFGALYLGSFLFFPAWWIEGEYPRYFAPVIPLCFVALVPWLPDRRAVVWAVGIMSAIIAAIEDMPGVVAAVSGLFR